MATLAGAAEAFMLDIEWQPLPLLWQIGYEEARSGKRGARMGAARRWRSDRRLL